MTQMLELSEKDSKRALITVERKNKLSMSANIVNLSTKRKDSLDGLKAA